MTPKPRSSTLADRSLPPGQSGWPLIGETLSFFRDPEFATKRYQKYGKVFQTHLLGQPTVFMRGTEANRFILTHENEYFQVSWPPSTKALLGPLSLALQTGNLHQQRRKLLAQAFLPRALAGYLDAMTQITQHYADRWQQQGTIVWYPELRDYTFDVACKLLAGLDHGSETNLGQLFERWSEGLFSIPLNLPWTKFGRAQQARDRLSQELEKLIVQRQESQESGTDTLGLLIQATDESGDRLSVAELKDQILLLLFAGHETLTSAIASFCLLTAQHPQVLEHLRAEQDQFDRHAPFTLEQLRQMTYLEQVLREVMRLIPPVGGGFRTTIAPFEFGGYQIPQGWTVLYQISSTHKDNELYEQPSLFDPERFAPAQLEQQSLDRQRYGYIPFGGGVRECLGKEFAKLEMKIFAAHLVRSYNWRLLPHQDLALVTIPTPHPKSGLKVHFSTRSGSQI